MLQNNIYLILFRCFSLKIKSKTFQKPSFTQNKQNFSKRFIQKKENFKKPSLLPFKKHSYPLSPKLAKLLLPKKKVIHKKEGKMGRKIVFKNQGKQFIPKWKKQKFLKNKFFVKKRVNLKKNYRKYKQKANFRYVKLLKKFVFYPKKLRTRFLFKLMLITKQAFLQYYRKFSLQNFNKIKKLYTNNRYQLTKFEKFIMFFEMRLNCILVRIKYAKYTLYSNMLILTGQIRVNGNVILFCDYQIKLYDIVEISYIAFYRQFFKRFLFRRYYKYHVHLYGNVYRYRSKYVFFLLKRKLKLLPRWLFYSVLRVFKVAPTYSLISHCPTNDYFVQSNRVLATIIYRLPYRFRDRKLSTFMTKKHMKFFSNFCTLFT